MEDNKSLEHQDETPDKKINNETLEIKNKDSETISNTKEELIESKNSKINSIDEGINKISDDEKLENNKKIELTSKLNTNMVSSNNIDKTNNDINQEKISEVKKLTIAELKSDTANNKLSKNVDSVNKETEKVNKLEENKKVILKSQSIPIADKSKLKEISNTTPVKAKTKPVKEPPIEKKPFLEFVNNYLIPEIEKEFKLKGKEVNKINLQKTNRPIAEDLCWVIYCEINDTCNFWLSFEKDDITSLKSFSLCKNYEKPSIIESFLIDEKKITLKLIISRILQRLNGQKLIGAN